MKEEHLHSRAEARLDHSGRMLGALDLLAVVVALVLLALSFFGMLDDSAGSAAALDARLDAGLHARRAALAAGSFDGQLYFARGDAARASLRASHEPTAQAVSPPFRAYPATWLAAARSGGNLAAISAPVDLVAEAGFGNVALRWTAGRGGNVPAGTWVLLRARPGEAYTTIAELPAATLHYVDPAPAGVEYQWRVAAKPGDPVLAAALGLSVPSSPVRSMALARVRWSILEASAATVRFRIEAWTGTAFEAREVDVNPGEAVEVAGGGQGFVTGCRLESIRAEDSTRRQEALRVVFDREGRVILEGGEPRREPVVTEVRTRRFEIVLRTETGGTEKVWFP